MSARSAKATCDRYVAQLVRARGACERCGSSGPLEAAHIIRRRYLGDPDGIALRHNEDNLWALCRPCHRIVDEDAVQFSLLVEKTIGFELYAELQAAKNAPHRPWREKDWQRERARLKVLLKQLNNSWSLP
jgi:ferredoxin